MYSKFWGKIRWSPPFKLYGKMDVWGVANGGRVKIVVTLSLIFNMFALSHVLISTSVFNYCIPLKNSSTWCYHYVKRGIFTRCPEKTPWYIFLMGWENNIIQYFAWFYGGWICFFSFGKKCQGGPFMFLISTPILWRSL